MRNPVNEVLEIFKNGWNKQVILYGPPGTSKTYSATMIAAAMLSGETYDYNTAKENLKEYEERGRYKLVQFHPSYSYEDFVRGITVKPGNGVTYEVEPKIIEKFCEGCSEENPKVLVIDEINRAPLASVLGELIYGLEYRGENVSTPYVIQKNGAEKPLSIPENLYIIGTMNTADRSIGSMDYAVRRRFAFVQVGSSPEAIRGSWDHIGDAAEKLYYALIMDKKEGVFRQDLLMDPEMDMEDIKIGHTYFLGKHGMAEKQEWDYLNYRIEYQIKPIYQEYIKDGLISQDGATELNRIIKEWRNAKATLDEPESGVAQQPETPT